MKLLSTTFSPMMLTEGVQAVVRPASLSEIPTEAKSIVGHETTALVLTKLMGREVRFNRANVQLVADDTLYCVIPGFRATEAREFTEEEVKTAGFRCFIVKIRRAS